jgi:hypothetical protein
LVKATDSPTEAAAGMVVIEMNTPISALARDSVSDTTPTMPASTATMTENRSGELIRLATGRTPSRKGSGTWPEARMARENRKVTMIVARKPATSALTDSRTGAQSRRLMPSAVAMIAKYSGPTTMAPMTRICELVRMPTAPMIPAMMSSM